MTESGALARGEWIAVHLGVPPDSTDHGSSYESSLVGRIIAGGLRVIERTGSTPDGPLYQAEYPDGRPVVLLVLHAGTAGREPSGAQWFRLATRIRHPNVAAVYAVGELENGSVYVALEQLIGDPLLHLLTEGRVFPLGEGLDLTLQAAAGLEAAHFAGFIHGNVSPSTVVVTRAPFGKSQVKLVGFNTDAARQLPTKLEAASVGYASPERLSGTPPDERCDVFSLGAVLHHLLSGKPPAQRVDGAVPAIARPVLAKALAPVPAARFQTMAELREALERLAAAAVTPRPAVVHRALIIRAVGVGVALVAGGLLLVPVWRRIETGQTRTVSLPATAKPAAVKPAPPPVRRARPAPARSPAPAESEARRGPVRPRSKAGNVAGAESKPAPEAGRIAAEKREVPEARGYVGQTTRSPVPAPPAERRTKPIAPPARPTPPPAAPRPRAVLEQNQALRHAIGDITRIGLAETVAEVRPGLLAVHLAEGGMGVPSAIYNLQQLYLAYIAATREQDTVAIELRHNGEPYGWFTREGLRHASSKVDRR